MGSQTLNVISDLRAGCSQTRIVALLMLLITMTITGAALQEDEPLLAVHPSEQLEPEGQLVTVIGKGFSPNIRVQLAQCTGLPLSCLVLADVDTNKHGRFVTRLRVAFDFSVLTPAPPTPTCSEPTFSGDRCLLFAVSWSSPQSAFTPLAFSE